MFEWLRIDGKNLGWILVTAKDAQEMANGGHPTIAILNNPNKDGHGHVAIVRPGTAVDPITHVPLPYDSPAIAQAGTLVTNADHLYDAVTIDENKEKIEYWYHE